MLRILLRSEFNCTSSVLFVGDHSLIQYSLQTILAQGGIHLFLVLGGSLSLFGAIGFFNSLFCFPLGGSHRRWAVSCLDISTTSITF